MQIKRRTSLSFNVWTVSLCLSLTPDEFNSFQKEAKKDKSYGRIWIIPRPNSSLVKLLSEYMALAHILKNEDEVMGDRILQREVKDRLSDADLRLRNTMQEVFWSFSSDILLFSGGRKFKEISSRRDFNQYISSICSNELYPKAPHLSCELINRRKKAHRLELLSINLFKHH